LSPECTLKKTSLQLTVGDANDDEDGLWDGEKKYTFLISLFAFVALISKSCCRTFPAFLLPSLYFPFLSSVSHCRRFSVTCQAENFAPFPGHTNTENIS